MNAQHRWAEEKKLDFFVGEWKNTGIVLPGPMGQGGHTTGETSYHWNVGGRWLIYKSRFVLPSLGDYEVRGGIAFNPRLKKYNAYAVNSFGKLLVYDGVWKDKNHLVFTLVHPESGRARIKYQTLPDGSIKMISENSTVDGKFEPYFEAVFTRL